MSARLRQLAREPLAHFVAAGAALFALDRAVHGRPVDALPAPAVCASSAAPTAPGPVVVDAGLRASVARAFEATEGRPPDARELERAVSSWVEDEVLFREGVRLGLERDDPAVRRRVAVKLLAVYRAGLALPAPTEPELRAHHEAHRDRWDKPALVDFTQVFVSGKGADAEARARELLARLSSGAEPSSLGDTYSGGRRYRLRPVAELREAFGADFADGLEQAPLGRWHERRSPAGLHLVRIEKRTPGERPSFEEVRGDVAADLGVERSERAIRARVQDLIRRAEVRERP